MECELERIHTSSKAYGSGFMMLSTNLYSVFTQYLISGRFRAPPASVLQELSPTFQDGAKTDRRALQSKFKSWAKRMLLHQDKLVLAQSGKFIVPRECCESVIKEIHMKNAEHHLSIDEVVTEIQRIYTWSRKNFGMDWTIVGSTLSKVCKDEVCLRELRERLFRPTVLTTSAITKSSVQSLLFNKRLLLNEECSSFRPDNSMVAIPMQNISHLLPYKRQRIIKPKTMGVAREIRPKTPSLQSKINFLKELNLNPSADRLKDDNGMLKSNEKTEDEYGKFLLENLALVTQKSTGDSGERNDGGQVDLDISKRVVCKNLFKVPNANETIIHKRDVGDGTSIIVTKQRPHHKSWDSTNMGNAKLMPDWRDGTIEPNDQMPKYPINADVEKKLKDIFEIAMKTQEGRKQRFSEFQVVKYHNPNSNSKAERVPNVIFISKDKKSPMIYCANNWKKISNSDAKNVAGAVVQPNKPLPICYSPKPLKRRIMECYERDMEKPSKIWRPDPETMGESQKSATAENETVESALVVKMNELKFKTESLFDDDDKKVQLVNISEQDDARKKESVCKKKPVKNGSNLFGEDIGVYDRMEVIKDVILKMEPQINLCVTGSNFGKCFDILDSQIDVALQLVRETKSCIEESL